MLGDVSALGASIATGASTHDEGPELDPAVTVAIDKGLRYLARTQRASGAWHADVGIKSSQSYRVVEADVPHVGVSALAGIAFLAGGHVPGRGTYGSTLDRTLSFVLDSVGDLGFAGAHQSRMYSHAFATLFLAEVYGMSAREELRIKLQQALDLIITCQNRDGSWRYQPFVPDSDMSVAVCQLMALRAARNAGLEVPSSTIDRATDYILRSRVDHQEEAWFRRETADYYCTDVGAFRYQVWGDQRSSFALTAAGVTSMFHAGRYDTRELRHSLRFLEEQLSRLNSRWTGHYFYYYGHYYGCQAMLLSGRDEDGGEYWPRYWTRTSNELTRQQTTDGHWPNPVGPGDAFATSIACIVLQAPYQYLPILQR